MIEAYSATDVRAAEQPLLAAERGFHGGLMDRAATALAGVVVGEVRRLTGGVVGRTAVGLVGSGSNGGDTLHALARLRRRGMDVRAVLTAPRVHDGGLAALRRAGGRAVAVVPDAPAPQVWLGDAVADAYAADVVLDGLLGIGARGGLREPAARVVELLGALLVASPAAPARPLVVAVDLPSGIGVDDGDVPGPVLPADVTVTFGAAKPALLLPPAAHLAGRLRVVDLGLHGSLADQGAAAAVRRLEATDGAALWPVPDPAGHKYSRGVVGVVAGTSAYPGAAVLTVGGAQGAGCGMVRYVGPPEVGGVVVAAHPEAVVGTSTDVRVQAWVVGPGLAPDDEEQRDRALQALAAAQDGVPVVVDAGALHLLGSRVPAHVVLTPHAGELARMLEVRGEDAERADVEREPLRHARRVHELTGATVLLKGPVTVVAGAGGVVAQADAPAWLATAGAGDVLAGVLGALLAGRAADLDDPALVADLAGLAALVHGRAARVARPGGPVTAGDVARALPGVVAELVA